VRVSDAHRQAVLAGLAPGPDREAVALWRGAPSPSGVAATPSGGELWAARTFIARHDRPVSEEPELILGAGAAAAPALAVDPATDRAVAAWLAPGASPRIEYAVSLDTGGNRRGAPAATVSPSAHDIDWRAVTLAGAGAAAATLLGFALLRRRGAR
jgi:hypothetical protein